MRASVVDLKRQAVLRVLQDFYSGRIRGIAFVEFYDSRDAEDCKYGMDRMVINGKEVRMCRPVGARGRGSCQSRRLALALGPASARPAGDHCLAAASWHCASAGLRY